MAPSSRRLAGVPPVLLTAATLVLACLVLYPVCVIVFSSFLVTTPGQPAVFGLDGWRAALAEPAIRGSIRNTLAVLLSHTLISMPVGTFIAWLLARTDLPWKRGLEFLFWIPLFLPPLAITFAWIILLDPDFGLINSWMTQMLHTAPVWNVYSIPGIVWVHLVTTAIAVKVMLLTPLFRNLDASLEEASRVCGATRGQTLLRIVLPAMAPALLAVTVLAVIYGLQAFEIELILGGPIHFDVYSTRIYGLLRQEPPLFGPATALSTMMLLLAAPLVLFQNRIAGPRYAILASGHRPGTVPLGRWTAPAVAFVVLVAGMLTLVPVVFLMLATFMRLFGYFQIQDPWTLDHWKRVLGDPIFLRSLRNTLQLGIGTALLSMLFLPLLAYLATRCRNARGAVLNYLTWLPIALPGILLGVGMLWALLGTSVLRPLYGTVTLLILAGVVANLTPGTQALKSGVLQIGADLEDTSRVSGASWWYMFRTIVFPLLKPLVLLTGVATFAGATRDVSSVALLATAGSRPLSLLQLDYLRGGQYESAFVVATLLVIVSVACAVLARFSGARSDVWR